MDELVRKTDELTDIVKRLLEGADYAWDTEAMTAAAAEITALRAEVERFKVSLSDAVRQTQEQADDITALRAENERLRSALIPFACRCARKGKGAGGTCLAPGGVCSSWNARAALEEKP